MLKNFLIAAFVLFPLPAFAGARFMPTAGCVQLVGFSDVVEQRAMETYVRVFFWAHTGVRPGADQKSTRALLRRVAERCASMPEGTSLEQAVAAAQFPAQPATDDATAVTEPALRSFLGRFLQPGADTRALTLQLRPTRADLDLIFKPDLADGAAGIVDKVFARGQIAPKPGQTELLIFIASTDDIINRTPALRKLPGGYKRVGDKVNPGIPVVRFKFVRPGEKLGMAFDLLYRVNGRWVLVPQIWRLLR